MPMSLAQASERLQFSIAGIGFELTWEEARLKKEQTLQFYQGFLVNGHDRSRANAINVQLEVHLGKLPERKPGALLFDAAASPNHWRLFRARDGFIFEFFAPKPPHPRVQLAVMAPDFRAGEVYRRYPKRRGQRYLPLERVMRPLGELLLVNLLCQGRGLLVHALGLSDQGEGVLCVGGSGAGKSTLAKLFKPHQGVTILCDERIVVTHEGGQFWISGTPWASEGMAVSADTVPLRKVFFLAHGTRNECIADSPLTLVSLLLQQVFMPFWNGEALGFALDFAGELFKNVPMCHLHFVNDPSVVAFLRGPACRPPVVAQA